MSRLLRKAPTDQMPSTISYPEYSTSFLGILTFKKEAENVAPPKKKGPWSFSVVPLMDKEVPYGYAIPHPKKIFIKDLGNKPIVLTKGTRAEYIAMFGGSQSLVCGNVYLFDGVCYTHFVHTDRETKVQENRRSISCCKIIPERDIDWQSLIGSIPFEHRSLNLVRDVPKFDQQFDSICEDQTFICIKVDPEGSDSANTLCGYITPPPQEGDPNVTAYKPQDKEKDLALTGGTDSDDGQKVLDLQFNFVQKAQEGTEVLIMGRGKLYRDSVKKFKVDWEKLGPTLAQHLYGDAICILNRKKTKKCIYDPDQYFGSVYLYIHLQPDLPKIIRKCGPKMSFDRCKQLAPMLSDMAHLEGPKEESDDTCLDVVNLLRFQGDASILEQGIRDGEIELYVISNMRMECCPSSMDEDEWFTELNVLKNFPKKERELAIFAIPTNGKSLRPLLVQNSFQMFPETKKSKVDE